MTYPNALVVLLVFFTGAASMFFALLFILRILFDREAFRGQFMRSFASYWPREFDAVHEDMHAFDRLPDDDFEHDFDQDEDEEQ